jgi:urate oxidase
VAHVLGPNQYGKAEVRLVTVDRSTPRHEIRDLTVTTQLRGDFEACHRVGDNTVVIPTDTQKNTVYAFAREQGVGEPEQFALLLGRHFVAHDQVDGARIAVDAHPWRRIPVAGSEHDHAFERAGAERRTTTVVLDPGTVTVVSGLADLVVLKSTGSEFHGYPRDRYTTLAETTDRILATSVTARWRYSADVLADGYHFGAAFTTVRTAMVETFAAHHSLALQQTLYAMGEAALDACPDILEVRMSMPNKHHFLVDLTPFGLENPNQVFVAADRPYGLIEGSVLREGVPTAPAVWESVVGFC